MVNTKHVTGRREVKYNSFEELLADAEKLVETEVQPLGNWSQGQIYQHLAQSLDASIDGLGFKFPAPIRWVMSLLMKKKFLYQSLPPGFRSTAAFIPDETPTDVGLMALRKAVGRQKAESFRVLHPGFGKLSREEWDAFNLRHAEMHMSFLVEK